VSVEEQLCACGRPQGHTGRHKGVSTVSLVKTTRHEMTVQQGDNSELVALVKALAGKVEALEQKFGTKPYELWSDQTEVMSRDIDSEDTAILWGARVPGIIVNAIWYSMTLQAKANLLSAIAVARYKDRPKTPAKE